MPTELERDITEIKVTVARVEEKLRQFDNHLLMFKDYEARLRNLENFKAKAVGYAGAFGAIGGIITALIIKLM